MTRRQRAVAVLGCALALAIPAIAGTQPWVDMYREFHPQAGDTCLTTNHTRATKTLRDGDLASSILSAGDNVAWMKMQEDKRLFLLKPDVKVSIVRTLTVNAHVLHEFRFEGLTETAWLSDDLKDCHH